MKLENMTIGQLAGLTSVLSQNSCESEKEEDLGKRIFILQRGWVFIGLGFQCGENVTIRAASCVRRWGTTKGLGELASNGPTKDTVLESCPDVHVHELAIVASMECQK